MADINQTDQIEDVNDDYNSWWIAGEKDDFDVKKKLLRVGCQGPLRQFLTCVQNREDEFTAHCAVDLIYIRKLRSSLEIAEKY